MTGFRRLADRRVHDGHIWHVVVANFEAPDGTRFERDVVRSPGSVAVVALSIDDRGAAAVVLVRQYRPALERAILELPAGMRDVPGEAPIDTGRRELVEEVGLAAGDIVHLVDLVPSPGMSDATCTVFLATGCTPVAHDRQGPEEDHMDVLHVGLDDALAMIDRGEITDAKTVCGLLATDRRLRRG